VCRATDNDEVNILEHIRVSIDNTDRPYNGGLTESVGDRLGNPARVSEH
jgi:hypothetical protein